MATIRQTYDSKRQQTSSEFVNLFVFGGMRLVATEQDGEILIGQGSTEIGSEVGIRNSLGPCNEGRELADEVTNWLRCINDDSRLSDGDYHDLAEGRIIYASPEDEARHAEILALPGAGLCEDCGCALSGQPGTCPGCEAGEDEDEQED